MTLQPDPIHLRNDLEEIADHEAGHIAVGYDQRLQPMSVNLYEMPSGIEARASHPYCCDEAGNLAFSPRDVRASLAGFLAQMKGVAERNAGGQVAFAPDQDWGEVARYLHGGEGEQSARIRLVTSDDRALFILPPDRRHLDNDLSKVRACLNDGTTDLIQATATHLRETAARLDTPLIWGWVRAIATRLAQVSPVPTRWLDGPELESLMPGRAG